MNRMYGKGLKQGIKKTVLKFHNETSGTTKKHIAQASCSLVVIAALLITYHSNAAIHSFRAETTKENNANQYASNIQLSADVVQDSEQSEVSNTTERAIVENTDQLSSNHNKQMTGNRTSSKAGGKANLVVSNQQSGKNIVVEENTQGEPNLFWAQATYGNYGSMPNWILGLPKKQYAVDLGEEADSNFLEKKEITTSSKNEGEPDDIINVVKKTEKEDSSSTTEELLKNQVTSEEVGTQSDAATENTTEQDNTTLKEPYEQNRDTTEEKVANATTEEVEDQVNSTKESTEDISSDDNKKELTEDSSNVNENSTEDSSIVTTQSYSIGKSGLRIVPTESSEYEQWKDQDNIIFATHNNHIALSGMDTEEAVSGEASEAVQKETVLSKEEFTKKVQNVKYTFADCERYILENLEDAEMILPETFFGKVEMECEDKQGNESPKSTYTMLVENDAPEVSFVTDDVCTAPYSLGVRVKEKGNIISGIQSITCKVNDVPYEIADLDKKGKVSLSDTLSVYSDEEFTVPLSESGEYEVVICVKDNAGNETTERKVVNIEEPELVSVCMPERFAIHIDPQRLLGKEQIFSDDLTLKNASEFDVKVNIDDVIVKVANETGDNGVKKDCKLFLVAPDTGEKISLTKGNNKKIYSFRLAAKQQNSQLHFVGETSKGSDSLWKESDIKIQVKFSFVKYEE